MSDNLKNNKKKDSLHFGLALRRITQGRTFLVTVFPNELNFNFMWEHRNFRATLKYLFYYCLKGNNGLNVFKKTKVVVLKKYIENKKCLFVFHIHLLFLLFE